MSKDNGLQRSEILFLYDIVDNNPNGDPLNDNQPRIDEETGENIVTDVRLKRTIRDYLLDHEDKEIFVKEIELEDGTIQDAKLRARDFIGPSEDFSDEENELIEKFLGGDGIKKQELKTLKKSIAKGLVSKAIDVRLFGATVPLEFKKGEFEDHDKNEKSSVTFTGPVQFNLGRSLHQVSMKHIRGTGAFASKKGAEQKTFREEDILHYSLIRFYGIINEEAGKHTNLKPEDIDALLRGIWFGTANLISRSKVGQKPRLLFNVKYNEKHFHLGDIYSYIDFQSEKDDLQIRSLKDGNLEIGALLDLFEDNSDKIDRVEYKLDPLVKFTDDEAQFEFEDEFKERTNVDLNPISLQKPE